MRNDYQYKLDRARCIFYTIPKKLVRRLLDDVERVNKEVRKRRKAGEFEQ